MNKSLLLAERVPQTVRGVENLGEETLRSHNEMLTLQVGALQQVLAIVVNKFGEERPEGGKHLVITSQEMQGLKPDTHMTTMMDGLNNFHIIVFEKEGRKA